MARATGVEERSTNARERDLLGLLFLLENLQEALVLLAPHLIDNELVELPPRARAATHTHPRTRDRGRPFVRCWHHTPVSAAGSAAGDAGTRHLKAQAHLQEGSGRLQPRHRRLMLT